MAAREIYIHRGRAKAAHAAASGQIKRLDRVWQVLESARPALSSQRTDVRELATAQRH